MHISLEAPDQYSVSSYDSKALISNGVTCQHSCILSKQGIITEWPIESIINLQENTLAPMLALQPEIILIGHNALNAAAPIETRLALAGQRIGLEVMSIGAACRTYNVLLSEHRNVVLGIIFDK